MQKEPLIINVCLTGNVPTKKDNPHVPLSPDEIIKDAAAVLELGATYLHIHARDENGYPDYKKEVFAKIISGIKKINDKVIICVTTSGRIFKKIEERSDALMLKNILKPDFASLTLGSFNFPKEECINAPATIQALYLLMREKGIFPEWEIFEPGMLHFGNYLVINKRIEKPRWINIFMGSLGTAPFNENMTRLFLSMLKPDWRFALAGVGKFQYRANQMSLKSGGHVRVGLEDSFYMDGEKKDPATNIRLVKRIVSEAKAVGRDIADFNITRKLLLS